MVLIISAGIVGFVHSLIPSHWLPLVLMSRIKKWPLRTTLLGALIGASGHIFLSVLLGILSLWIELRFFIEHEHQLEKFSGLFLALFGITYTLFAFFKHSRCEGHTHHGPDPQKSLKTPFIFLFSLGFFPCIAVLPLFIAASVEGAGVLMASLFSFTFGVVSSFVLSSYFVSQGLLKLDLAIFEHYGDVLTGSVLTLAGLASFLFLT